MLKKEFKINLGDVGIVRKFLYSLDLNSSLVEFFLTNLKLFNSEKYEDALLSKANFQNLIKSNEKEQESQRQRLLGSED